MTMRVKELFAGREKTLIPPDPAVETVRAERDRAWKNVALMEGHLRHTKTEMSAMRALLEAQATGIARLEKAVLDLVRGAQNERHTRETTADMGDL